MKRRPLSYWLLSIGFGLIPGAWIGGLVAFIDPWVGLGLFVILGLIGLDMVFRERHSEDDDGLEDYGSYGGSD